jgi:RsiW-degrading membrane proteinase PrsW (M82 family)
MAEERDPVEAASDGRDLYDVTSWEPRSRLDRLSVRLYGGLIRAARAVVVLVAILILIAQFALTGLAAAANPSVGAFILLSVVPAFAIAAYFWRADVTMREPPGTLLITFLLGVLLAGFASVLNTVASPLFETIPLVGLALFFYLIVAPVEEFVKWLAVRLYAFRRPEFSAVVDGAVYGAVAGLGFATIENTVYISGQYLSAIEAGEGGVFAATLQTTALRTFAGPGHVIYSGFAGYYLGLAKYNRGNAGPIVLKGLLIAAFVHATYNTLVGVVPAVASVVFDVAWPVAFIAFILVYDGVFGYLLYRKVRRYRQVYDATGAGRDREGSAAEETSPMAADPGDHDDAGEGRGRETTATRGGADRDTAATGGRGERAATPAGEDPLDSLLADESPDASDDRVQKSTEDESPEGDSPSSTGFDWDDPGHSGADEDESDAGQ